MACENFQAGLEKIELSSMIGPPSKRTIIRQHSPRNQISQRHEPAQTRAHSLAHPNFWALREVMEMTKQFLRDPARGPSPLFRRCRAARAEATPHVFRPRSDRGSLRQRAHVPVRPARPPRRLYFRWVFDQPQPLSPKSLILWRSLGDSNPCFRRERARLSRYLIVRAALAPASPRPHVWPARASVHRGRAAPHSCWARAADRRTDSFQSRPQDWPWRSRRVAC
jgi:hypothetical protein